MEHGNYNNIDINNSVSSRGNENEENHQLGDMVLIIITPDSQH